MTEVFDDYWSAPAPEIDDGVTPFRDQGAVLELRRVSMDRFELVYPREDGDELMVVMTRSEGGWTASHPDDREDADPTIYGSWQELYRAWFA